MHVDGYFMCSQAKVLNFLSVQNSMEDTIKMQNSDSEFSAMLYGRIEVAMLE